MTKTNYMLDIPEEEYHNAARNGEYLSSHLLGDFRSCPLTYHKKLCGEIQDSETPSLLLGRAAHKLILEGSVAFLDAFEISDGPINPKTGEPFGKATKAHQEWLETRTKPVINGKDYALITKMENAVRNHSQASHLLSNGNAEATIRATYGDTPCQIRMDFFNPTCGIVDLKTCDDLSSFERAFRSLGYGYQLAFYREVLGKVTGARHPAYIIAVEKKEPFRVGVWRLSDELLEQAARVNEAAIRRLLNCKETNSWPTLFEEIRTFTEL